ncbi:hypothetical protein CKAH01_13009 [Colletotrichum kahawae]|uniref:Uncharacterized protein n=1 Tax=Colletotrichum kahawae TaxID=34407 RepID=A0AAD9YPV7_COLKA|nr:hypothetical protein CKAH01_13009 [Colletotrichum kahawae]
MPATDWAQRPRSRSISAAHLRMNLGDAEELGPGTSLYVTVAGPQGQQLRYVLCQHARVQAADPSGEHLVTG